MFVGAPPSLQPLRQRENQQQFKMAQVNPAVVGRSKRENITQVIKDCFITRKCAVNKPAKPQSNLGHYGYSDLQNTKIN